MSHSSAPRAARARLAVRAAFAALTALSIVAATPASAVVIRDSSGKMVILPPKGPQPGYPRIDAEQLASACGEREVTDPLATHYSNTELTAAAQKLLMTAAQVRASGMNADPAYGTPENEIAALTSAANELQRCKFNNDQLWRASRALDSCDALMKEVEETDALAVDLFNRKGITRSHWVRSLELFLPAAQSCRNKLGRCYNPNNKSQTRALLTLLRLQNALKFTSQHQAQLKLKIPTCTKTMLKEGLDKPDRDNRPQIEYINMMAGDDFTSVGGEQR